LWTIFFSLTSNTALIAKAFKSGSYPGLCLISGRYVKLCQGHPGLFSFFA
jgi:hypothetical protein